MEKEEAIRRLREKGFRITRQRKVLIDIILSRACDCCKEVFFLARQIDPGIGVSTVYRTIDALEQVGALKRKNSYELCSQKGKICRGCCIEFENHKTIELDSSSLERVIEHGIKKCGLSDGEKVRSIIWKQEE